MEELNELEIDEKDTAEHWGISQKWKYFVDCYYSVSAFCGYDAYMKAYPECKSVESASTSASRLLYHDKLKGYLNHVKERHTKRMLLTSHQMIDTMEKMYLTDIEDVLDILFVQRPVVGSDGKIVCDEESGEPIYEINKSICVKDLKSLPKFMRLAIQEVKETREGLQIRLVDKNKLNELIGKWKGAFIDKKEVGINGAVQIIAPDVNKWDDEE